MMFLTGNADNGGFAVAEATVMARCGMTENTYKTARKSLVEKGWIIHKPSQNGQQGEIIVDYDAIYKSAERDNENAPTEDNENTLLKTENTPLRNDENTHNNITENINRNNINPNTINQKNPKAKVDFMDKDGNFIF